MATVSSLIVFTLAVIWVLFEAPKLVYLVDDTLYGNTTYYAIPQLLGTKEPCKSRPLSILGHASLAATLLFYTFWRVTTQQPLYEGVGGILSRLRCEDVDIDIPTDPKATDSSTTMDGSSASSSSQNKADDQPRGWKRTFTFTFTTYHAFWIMHCLFGWWVLEHAHNFATMDATLAFWINCLLVCALSVAALWFHRTPMYYLAILTVPVWFNVIVLALMHPLTFILLVAAIVILAF